VPRNPLLLAVATCLVASIAGVAPATHAYAAPTPQEIESQMDALWAKLEPTIEQYNGLQVKLNQDQSRQRQLQHQLDPLQMQVNLAMSRVGAISASLYERGPASKVAALLNAGGPDVLVNQMNSLDQLARGQQATVSATRSQINDYNKQKAPLDALVAQEQQEVAALAAQKQQIQDQLAQLDKLRLQAYGSSGAAGGSLKPVACPLSYPGGAAAKAVSYACSKIGAPYVFATNGPSTFDCSGLTQAAWGSAGVSLDHFTGSQQQNTKSVSLANLRAGDLVFYGSPAYHVAIFVGKDSAGKYWVVHAPRSGDHVREAQMYTIGTPSSYGRPG